MRAKALSRWEFLILKLLYHKKNPIQHSIFEFEKSFEE
jgi:hypothetical protein